MLGLAPIAGAPIAGTVTTSAGAGTATLAATLGALTLASTGTLPILGITSATLGTLTLAATGAVAIQGTLSGTLGALTLAATGAGVQARTATLTATLGTLTLAATNIVARKPLPTWYYIPGPIPASADPWMRREFERVSQATFAAAPALQLQVLSVAPDKPREGMVVYADGAVWNPGAGVGVYVRGSAAWAKL